MSKNIGDGRGSRNKDKPVFVFDKDKKFVRKYESTGEAADDLKLNIKTIHTAIYTQNLCDKKWHFSRTEEWIPVDKSTRRIKKFFKKLDDKEED